MPWTIAVNMNRQDTDITDYNTTGWSVGGESTR
jgi:hypothetical protein